MGKFVNNDIYGLGDGLEGDNIPERETLEEDEDPKNVRLCLENLHQTLLPETYVIDIVGEGSGMYLWFGRADGHVGYVAHIDNCKELRKWLKKALKRARKP